MVGLGRLQKRPLQKKGVKCNSKRDSLGKERDPNLHHAFLGKRNSKSPSKGIAWEGKKGKRKEKRKKVQGDLRAS